MSEKRGTQAIGPFEVNYHYSTSADDGSLTVRVGGESCSHLTFAGLLDLVKFAVDHWRAKERLCFDLADSD